MARTPGFIICQLLQFRCSSCHIAPAHASRQPFSRAFSLLYSLDFFLPPTLRQYRHFTWKAELHFSTSTKSDQISTQARDPQKRTLSQDTKHLAAGNKETRILRWNQSSSKAHSLLAVLCKTPEALACLDSLFDIVL